MGVKGWSRGTDVLSRPALSMPVPILFEVRGLGAAGEGAEFPQVTDVSVASWTNVRSTPCRGRQPLAKVDTRRSMAPEAGVGVVVEFGNFLLEWLIVLFRFGGPFIGLFLGVNTPWLCGASDWDLPRFHCPSPTTVVRPGGRRFHRSFAIPNSKSWSRRKSSVSTSSDSILRLYPFIVKPLLLRLHLSVEPPNRRLQ